MARALKVFCTPIGFHDAYVAAPSKKAALEAWGSDANLFARGMATIVTDPALTKEPLAAPGQIIKRARGTTAEHLAALPKSPKPTSKRSPSELAAAGEQEKPSKPKPKPSRRKLEAAELTLERADDKYRKLADAIHEREEALRRERHELSTKRNTEIAKVQRRLDDTRAEYNRAMDEWRA